MMTRQSIGIDNFTLALVATVTTATLLPASGLMARFFDGATVFAIALLFFLHGAKLSREAVIAGASHWRLHLTVVFSTFLLFPLLGFALKPLLSPLVTPELYLGVLFVCALPATVQSAIAFTSIARGNVPAAICAASASSFIGIFLTPVLVGILMGSQLPAAGNGDTLHAIGKIIVQLLLPFIAGQIARGWIGGWVDRNKGLLKFVDQGSILLVVYVAFSAAVLQGLWHQVPLHSLAGLLVVNARTADPGAALHPLCRTPAGLRPRRRDHHRVLRLQEEPGQRHSDGPGAVRRPRGGRHRAAADAVPPDPADGLRRAGAEIRGAARGHRQHSTHRDRGCAEAHLNRLRHTGASRYPEQASARSALDTGLRRYDVPGLFVTDKSRAYSLSPPSTSSTRPLK